MSLAQENACTGIHPWLNAEDKLTVDLFADNNQIAQIDYATANDTVSRTPACKVILPQGIKKLSVKGELIMKSGSLKIENYWNTFDVGKYTSSFYDAQKPFLDRIVALNKTLRGLEEENDEYLNPIEVNDVDSSSDAFAKMCQKLGLNLPEELAFMTKYRFTLGDNFFRKFDVLDTVANILRDEWSYEESGDNPLSKIIDAELLKRFERSIMIFEEVGDGLGALAWDPAGVTDGESSGLWFDKYSDGAKSGDKDNGVWYWLHQDTLTEPEMLLDSKLTPVNAETAILNAFQRFAVEPDSILEVFADQDFEDPYCIVDSSHPNGMLVLIVNDEFQNLSDGSYDYTLTIAL